MGDKAMRPSKHPMDPHDTKQLDYINSQHYDNHNVDCILVLDGLFV